MDKPELYSAANALQRKAGLECIEEFKEIIKWNKEGKCIIDLGCGDGSFTTFLKQKYIPKNYIKLVGCDINKNMVDFANDNYGTDTVTFRVWDIESDLPDDFVGAFYHVLSFFVLHWINRQEKAIQNVYDLLTKDGDCLLTMLARMPIVEMFIIMSKTTKWYSLLTNLETIFVSPYHRLKAPEKMVTTIMEKIGFKNIDVQCKEKEYTFKNLEELKRVIRAVEPFHMSNEVFEDFMQDFVKTSQEVKLKDFTIDTNNQPFSYKYHMVVAYGTK